MPDSVNYQQPDYVEKRVRYFDGQYLKVQDFVNEQQYHIDRLRRHHRFLVVSGIVDGLTVTAKANSAGVTISAGTAIDKEGRQILLNKSYLFNVEEFPKAGETTSNTPGVELDLQSYKDKGDCNLFIIYDERETDQQSEGGSQNDTRFHERPKFEVIPVNQSQSDQGILLAKLKITADKVEVNSSVRQYSGLRLPGAETSEVTLRYQGDKNSKLAVLTGSLSVTGNLAIRYGKYVLINPETNYPNGTNNLIGVEWENHADTVKIYTPGSQRKDPVMALNSKGNVGIGTTNPQGFHVVLPESNKTSTPKAGITMAGGKNGNASIELRNEKEGTPYIDFAQNESKDYDARIRLTAPGKLAIEGAKVGIGIVDPGDYLLNVEGGNTRLNGALTVTGNTDIDGNIQIKGSQIKSKDGYGIVETNKTDWLRINPDSKYPGIALFKPVAIGTGGLAVGEWTQQSQGVLKVTQSAYLATVSGNVGINTTEPQAKLDVNGNTRLNGALTVTGNTDIGGKVWIKDGNVGIGTTTTQAQLNVNGNTRLNGTLTVTAKTDDGSPKLKIANPDSDSDFVDFTFYGKGMGQLIIDGWSNGWNISNTTNGKHLYLNRNAGEKSDVYVGRNGHELVVKGQDGKVGIGTSSPEGKLGVTAVNANGIVVRTSFSGNKENVPAVWAENKMGGSGGGQGWAFWSNNSNGKNYGNHSSIRWKKNIRPLKGALDKILNIRGVYFTWKETECHDLGFIAEEVGDYIPEAVSYENDTEYATGISYNHVIPVIVEAVKEQHTILQKIQERMNKLEGKS